MNDELVRILDGLSDFFKELPDEEVINILTAVEVVYRRAYTVGVNDLADKIAGLIEDMRKDCALAEVIMGGDDLVKEQVDISMSALEEFSIRFVDAVQNDLILTKESAH